MSNNNLRSRQMNPCDHLFWKSRGYPERPENWEDVLEDMGYYDDDPDSDQTNSSDYSDYETDSEEGSFESDSDYEENRAKSNQNNPNNDEYWILRGWSERPDDWRDRINGKLPEYKPKHSPNKRTSPQNSNEWWKYGKNHI